MRTVKDVEEFKQKVKFYSLELKKHTLSENDLISVLKSLQNYFIDAIHSPFIQGSTDEKKSINPSLSIVNEMEYAEEIFDILVNLLEAIKTYVHYDFSDYSCSQPFGIISIGKYGDEFLSYKLRNPITEEVYHGEIDYKELKTENSIPSSATDISELFPQILKITTENKHTDHLNYYSNPSIAFNFLKFLANIKIHIAPGLKIYDLINFLQNKFLEKVSKDTIENEFSKFEENQKEVESKNEIGLKREAKSLWDELNSRRENGLREQWHYLKRKCFLKSFFQFFLSAFYVRLFSAYSTREMVFAFF